MTKEDTQSSNEKGKSGKSTNIPLVSWLLKLILKILSLAILAGFIHLLIEFILFFFVDDPLTSAIRRHEAVSRFITDNWLDQNSLLKGVETRLLDLIHVKELLVWANYYSQLLSANISEIRVQQKSIKTILSLIQNGIENVPDIFSLWLVVTMTWAAKVISIIALLPPCALILGCGFIDGTTERKINTYKGKRDSQDKIEWWFLAFKSSTYTVMFLYVAIPNSITAPTLLFPSVVFSAICLRNVAANYKKYW